MSQFRSESRNYKRKTAKWRGNRAVTYNDCLRTVVPSQMQNVAAWGQQSIDSARAHTHITFFFFSFSSHFDRSFALVFLFFRLKFFCSICWQRCVRWMNWRFSFLWFSVNMYRVHTAVYSHRIHLQWPQSHRFVHWITIVSSIYVNWRLNWNFFFALLLCRRRMCLRHSQFIHTYIVYISISPSSMTTSSIRALSTWFPFAENAVPIMLYVDLASTTPQVQSTISVCVRWALCSIHLFLVHCK